MKPTKEERFYEKLSKPGCIIWLGARNSWGYGTFCWEPGKNINASRAAWLLAKGPIPEGMDVLHHCDNKLCCNVEHMYLGTDKENARDRVIRGFHPKGSRVHFAKLTEEKVREIKRRHIPAKPGQKGGNTKELAAEYGVQPGMITAIASGRTWKHVV